MTTLAQTLDLAVRHHQAGNLLQAEQLYRQILQVDPRQADAWHLLGLIAGQVDRHDLAIEYIGQALRLKPAFPQAHYNLGNFLKDQGKMAEAEANYREALRFKPDYAEAHNNLGIVLQNQGKKEEAEANYREACRLQPDNAEAYSNLGNVLNDQSKKDEAQANYREALRLKPVFPEAHNNLGNVLKDQGKRKEAEDSYREALRLQPDYAEALSNLGLILNDQGKMAEAEANYRKALILKPDYAEAHNNLGIVLQNQGKKDEAEANYREACRLQPDNAEAHSNLGNVLYDQDKKEEAEANYRKALRLKPSYPKAHNNLGNVLRDQDKMKEAENSYREALRLTPAFPEAHYNLGTLWLLMGNFAEGWPEYEWRLKVKKLSFRSFPQPRWDGASLNGKTILLYAEQGLGDTLQFIRYAPLVKQQGGRVLFECPAELVGIIQTCAGIDQVLTQGNPLSSFDVQAPLLSLPGILKTTLATMPASFPYLSADPALTERWRQELSHYSGFKIGIVWQGNPRFSQPECRAADQRRSIPLARFEPLACLPGVRLFSLQKGFGTEQLAQWQARFEIFDLGDKLNDFMDTAAVMMNLDLIISADTSPVHLAGALGRPVWTVLPFAGCWRWLQDRADSPWYPTMRLFRQNRPGDWGEVFKRVAATLRDLVATRSGGK